MWTNEQNLAEPDCPYCGGRGYTLAADEDDRTECVCVRAHKAQVEEMRAEAQFEAERGN